MCQFICKQVITVGLDNFLHNLNYLSIQLLPTYVISNRVVIHFHSILFQKSFLLDHLIITKKYVPSVWIPNMWGLYQSAFTISAFTHIYHNQEKNVPDPNVACLLLCQWHNDYSMTASINISPCQMYIHKFWYCSDIDHFLGISSKIGSLTPWWKYSHPYFWFFGMIQGQPESNNNPSFLDVLVNIKMW